MATALKGLGNNRIYCFLHYSQLNNIRLFILFNTRKSYICSIRKVTLNDFRCDLAIYIYKKKKFSFKMTRSTTISFAIDALGTPGIGRLQPHTQLSAAHPQIWHASGEHLSV